MPAYPSCCAILDCSTCRWYSMLIASVLVLSVPPLVLRSPPVSAEAADSGAFTSLLARAPTEDMVAEVLLANCAEPVVSGERKTRRGTAKRGRESNDDTF